MGIYFTVQEHDPLPEKGPQYVKKNFWKISMKHLYLCLYEKDY
jgi:hypothetical protein